jgi:hypothetical protein
MLRLRRAVREHRCLGLLLLAAIAAVVLQGGSMPHTHAGIGPGFYNQDHDRALLATLHGSATVPAVAPAILPVVVVSPVVVPATDALDSAPRRAADSRAPPLV